MPDDPRIGTELAGYRIETMIGRGGMGVVYRAEHLRLGRKVALKLLTPELAENEGFRARFESESRLAAAIDHPHIIPLFEAGDAEGLLFLTMRYVDGIDLKGLLQKEGPLPVDRALTIVGQVGGALDAAHARDLVHRDVKPANVLVASGIGPDVAEHCYLTDFGLTKDTSVGGGLTATGQFVGTIAYVAPEQIEGTTQSGATDQYALGCVLYECLTGHPPFERKTELDVMWAHISDDPPEASARRSDLPRQLDGVLAKALAKSPDDRYESCTAMVNAARAALPAAAGAGAGAAGATPAGETVAAGATRLSPQGAGSTALSPEPVPAGPTRPSPAPAGATVPAAPAAAAKPRSRVPLIAAALAAAVVAGGAGAVLGGSGDEAAPAAGNVAATGGLSLRFPTAWETLASPPDIPGLDFQDRIAIGPRSGGGREGLVAGRIASGGGGVLPAGLYEGDAPPARDAVRLGDAEAFRYQRVRPSGFAGTATLYVVLTDKGRVGIACYAAAPSPRFTKDCSDVAASLDLTDAKALPVAPSAEYAKAVTDLLAGLARDRRSGREELAQAGTSVSQAAAAAALARTYAATGRRARGLPAPPAARPSNTAIAAAIAAVADAYESVASAARTRDAARYGRAGRAARRAEGRLAGAVGGLAELGYTVRT